MYAAVILTESIYFFPISERSKVCDVNKLAFSRFTMVLVILNFGTPSSSKEMFISRILTDLPCFLIPTFSTNTIYKLHTNTDGVVDMIQTMTMRNFIPLQVYDFSSLVCDWSCDLGLRLTFFLTILVLGFITFSGMFYYQYFFNYHPTTTSRQYSQDESPSYRCFLFLFYKKSFEYQVYVIKHLDCNLQLCL